MSTDPGTDLTATAPDMTRGVVQGASLESRIRYAETLAAAGLVPKDYQRCPANVLYAVETGTMLGIHPIAAINGINVISGKPTISPALMTALVRRAGHKVRIRVEGTVEGGDVRATCEVIRADDPGFAYGSTWDIARAKRAGLWGGKGPWTNYPEAMLKARAIGEVCREAAEDALCGVHYTPEEMGAVVDVEGVVLDRAPDTTRAAPTGPAPLDADLVRAAVLDARTRAELTENLVQVAAVQRTPDGAVVWHRMDDLRRLHIADAQGEDVTAFALIAAVGKALPEVAPEDTSPEEVLDAGPDPTAPVEDVVDAEVVDDTVERSDQGVTRQTPTGAARALVQAEKTRIAARAREVAEQEENDRER